MQNTALGNTGNDGIGMISSAWPRPAPDPGGQNADFHVLAPRWHEAAGWSEVRLGHSGLGLGQGHQVSRLAGQRQACDTVTCHPCNQVLRAVASPEH